MDRDILDLDYYHRPKICSVCGGVMIFVGVGEYHCEDCKSVAFDDYGKVRNFIESHKGATASIIAAETGVSQRTIRQLLQESRIEVAADSRAFLHCELCGINIRYGRFCPKCESNYHANIEQKQRSQKLMKGFGAIETHSESPEMKFLRKK
jgi:uncharacterized Zn finger protein (UPF0148 family)